jgi:hypothetical protein
MSGYGDPRSDGVPCQDSMRIERAEGCKGYVRQAREERAVSGLRY